MTIEQLRELIEQMNNDPGGVTDEQLTQGREFIREQVQALGQATPSQDVISALTELRDARTAISAQQDERAAAVAELDEQRRGLLESLTDPETPAAPEQSAEGEGGAATGNEPPADAQVPEQGQPVDAAPTEGAPEQPAEAVAASARRAPVGTFRTPAPKPARDTSQVARTVVTAAGGAPGYPQGQEIRSSADLAAAMTARLRSLASGHGGTGEKLYVARADTTYPEDRVLRAEDWVGNYSKIERATSPQALVAAGGLCAPLETLYDVEVIGSSDRPIRDALAPFQVDRGGIQFRPNSSAATALTTGTGTGTDVWTMTQDAAGTASKTCYVVDCPAIQTAVIDAIYLCLEFGNITARFDPETTASNVRQGVIAHNRLAENNLLAKLQAGSKIVTAPKVVGAVRDVLANIDKACAYYRHRHRLNSSTPLTWMAPAWVLYEMRTDLARQMAAGDWMSALGVTDQMIAGWLAARGISPVWHLDGGPPAGGTNEVQTVTITGTPTGGTFTLTYAGQTTAPIAYNATAATVLAALQQLSNIRPNDLTTAGGALPGTAVTVAFGGQFAGTDVAAMTASGAGLTGGSSPAVAITTTTAGSSGSTVSGISIAAQVYANVAAGATLPPYPAQIDSLLFATGTKLFLDGGSLDLGLVRDSTLNSRNRYRQFSETFEGVADRGVENLRIIMNCYPTGQSAGTADTSAVTN